MRVFHGVGHEILDRLSQAGGVPLEFAQTPLDRDAIGVEGGDVVRDFFGELSQGDMPTHGGGEHFGLRDGGHEVVEQDLESFDGATGCGSSTVDVGARAISLEQLQVAANDREWRPKFVHHEREALGSIVLVRVVSRHRRPLRVIDDRGSMITPVCDTPRSDAERVSFGRSAPSQS